jgi:hypothetical protein
MKTELMMEEIDEDVRHIRTYIFVDNSLLFIGEAAEGVQSERTGHTVRTQRNCMY